MGILEESIHELIEAITTGNKAEREKILKRLEKVGMDRQSAYIAAMAIAQESK